MKDAVISYWIVFNYSGNEKRYPSTGIYRIKIYKHPVSFFQVKKIVACAGDKVIAMIKVRNIMDEDGDVYINISNGIFVENDKNKLKINVIKNEEKIYFVVIRNLKVGKNEICMDSNITYKRYFLNDRDCIDIEYVIPPILSAENKISIVLLFLFSIFIYLLIKMK